MLNLIFNEIFCRSSCKVEFVYYLCISIKPMAQSKHRPKFKANKKRNNIKKQKQKEMQNANQEKENPVTWAYHKDRETVEVPIKAWQMINQAANELQAIARFVSVTEQIGNLHQQDGTLLPVYKDDLEAIPGKR